MFDGSMHISDLRDIIMGYDYRTVVSTVCTCKPRLSLKSKSKAASAGNSYQQCAVCGQNNRVDN